MNDYIAMFVDSGLSQHWPDLLMAAFVAFGFWILERSISRNESRHQRAEDNFKEQDKCISGLDTRVTVLETIVPLRKKERH